jgi:hypothetical protein
VLEALKVEVEEVLRERKMLREAPVRSMVTVVALECSDAGQWRSIGPGSVESGVEWRVFSHNGAVMFKQLGASKQELFAKHWSKLF